MDRFTSACALSLLLTVARPAPAAAENRGFSVDEVFSLILTSYRTQQIAKGHNPESMTIASNGKQAALTELDDSMRSHLFIFDLAAKTFRALPTERAFVTSAILLGGAKGPATGLLACFGRGPKPAGIYELEIDKGAARSWRSVVLGKYRELALSSDESLLAMVRTVDEPSGDAELWIQKLDAGKPIDAPYRVASNLKGILRSPAFSKDGGHLYFELSAKPGEVNPEGLYRVDNRPDAAAVLEAEGVAEPSPVWNFLLEDFTKRDLLLVTKMVEDNGRFVPDKNIYEYDVAKKKLTPFATCSGGVYCRLPKVSPAGGTIYFTAYRFVDGVGISAILQNGL